MGFKREKIILLLSFSLPPPSLPVGWLEHQLFPIGIFWQLHQTFVKFKGLLVNVAEKQKFAFWTSGRHVNARVGRSAEVPNLTLLQYFDRW